VPLALALAHQSFTSPHTNSAQHNVDGPALVGGSFGAGRRLLRRPPKSACVTRPFGPPSPRCGRHGPRRVSAGSVWAPVYCPSQSCSARSGELRRRAFRSSTLPHCLRQRYRSARSPPISPQTILPTPRSTKLLVCHSRRRRGARGWRWPVPPSVSRPCGLAGVVSGPESGPP